MNKRLFFPVFCVAAALMASGAAPRVAHGQCESWQSLPGGGMAGPAGSAVYALTTYNGDLIVGGDFLQAGPQSVNRIARLSGSNWFPLGGGIGGANPKVLALAVYNGELIAAGDFTLVNGAATTANRIARWNGSFWQPLGAGMNGPVNALAVFNNELIAGGNFTTAGGQSASFIARWNGSTWQPMGGFNSSVTCLTIYNNELVAGGAFTAPGARIARWNGLAWQALPAGGFINTVLALTVYNGELFAGGLFTMVDGAPNGTYIAHLTTTSGWDPLGGGGTNDVVTSLAVHKGKLIVGGSFTFAGNDPIGFGIASWNPTTLWDPVGGGMSFGGDVLALSLYNGDLIVGGEFVSAGGVSASKIARFWGHKWLNPISGAFTSGSNWSQFAHPPPQCSATFGNVLSSTGYTVTFPTNLSNIACYITNHKPMFDLGGFHYSTNQLIVGESQTASLTVTNGTMTTSTTTIGPFGTLAVNNGGTLTMSSPTTIVPQAVLTGDGTLAGNVINTGTIAPGNPTGVLTLNGSFIQYPSGVFHTMIDTDEQGRLTVSGNAALTGTLKVSLVEGADPPSGQFYPVLSVDGELIGGFALALLPFLGPDQAISVQYVTEGSSLVGGGGSGVVIVIGQPDGSPDFGEPETFALEGEPTGIADANIGVSTAARDLALSVTAPSPSDPGNVLVLFNQGDGSAFDPVVVPVGRRPSGIAAADLAGNGGDDDLAVPNKGDDTVSVLFHDGAGAFSSLTLVVGDAPTAIAGADLQGRGGIDLAVANQDDNTVTVLLNDGTGSFTAQPAVLAGQQPSAIAAAPLVTEKVPDLVVANLAAATITVLGNDGSGGFTIAATLPVGEDPIDVDPADVDNDRDLDLVAANSGSNSVSIVLNLGNGQFAPAVHLPVEGSPQSVSGWDMDGDSDVDLVAVINDDELGPVIRILRNDTASSGAPVAFTLFDPIAQGEQPRLVRGADVTGDLSDDLVAVNVSAIPLAGGASSSLSIRPNLFKLHPGDITGDGQVNVDDLLAVINAWGDCPLKPLPCPADIAPPGGDGFVNVDDLLMVINNWG